MSVIFIDSPDLQDAKEKVEDAIRTYLLATASLSTTIGTQILNEKRNTDILEWIWTGDFEARHRTFKKKRVLHSGQWFLESDEYNKWIRSNGSSVLICPGRGIQHSLPANQPSWCRKIIYHVRFPSKCQTDNQGLLSSMISWKPLKLVSYIFTSISRMRVKPQNTWLQVFSSSWFTSL